MKKRRLKKWVRITLACIGYILLFVLTLKGLNIYINRYNQAQRECNELLQKFCSNYEVSKYVRGDYNN
mgnify:CR=1 FL=1